MLLNKIGQSRLTTDNNPNGSVGNQTQGNNAGWANDGLSAFTPGPAPAAVAADSSTSSAKESEGKGATKLALLNLKLFISDFIQSIIFPRSSDPAAIVARHEQEHMQEMRDEE